MEVPLHSAVVAPRRSCHAEIGFSADPEKFDDDPSQRNMYIAVAPVDCEVVGHVGCTALIPARPTARSAGVHAPRSKNGSRLSAASGNDDKDPTRKIVACTTRKMSSPLNCEVTAETRSALAQ